MVLTIPADIIHVTSWAGRISLKGRPHERLPRNQTKSLGARVGISVFLHCAYIESSGTLRFFPITLAVKGIKSVPSLCVCVSVSQWALSVKSGSKRTQNRRPSINFLTAVTVTLSWDVRSAGPTISAGSAFYRYPFLDQINFLVQVIHRWKLNWCSNPIGDSFLWANNQSKSDITFGKGLVILGGINILESYDLNAASNLVIISGVVTVKTWPRNFMANTVFHISVLEVNLICEFPWWKWSLKSLPKGKQIQECQRICQ